jgi:hypothetical protein
MGVNKSGEDNKEFAAGFAAGFAAAREDDLSHLDLTTSTLERTLDANETDEGSKGFVAATEDNLSHIAPGCFVLVGSGQESCWVEIGRIEGETVSGIAHPELSNSLCLVQHDYCEIASFSRDQITALGCDRYCWC